MISAVFPHDTIRGWGECQRVCGSIPRRYQCVAEEGRWRQARPARQARPPDREAVPSGTGAVERGRKVRGGGEARVHLQGYDSSRAETVLGNGQLCGLRTGLLTLPVVIAIRRTPTCQPVAAVLRPTRSQWRARLADRNNRLHGCMALSQ